MVFKNKCKSHTDKEFNEVFFFWTKKNIKLKDIESYKSRERYHAVIFYFPNFVWD